LMWKVSSAGAPDARPGGGPTRRRHQQEQPRGRDADEDAHDAEVVQGVPPPPSCASRSASLPLGRSWTACMMITKSVVMAEVCPEAGGDSKNSLAMQVVLATFTMNFYYHHRPLGTLPPSRHSSLSACRPFTT
jgi:hypothetical protein